MAKFLLEYKFVLLVGLIFCILFSGCPNAWADDSSIVSCDSTNNAVIETEEAFGSSDEDGYSSSKSSSFVEADPSVGKTDELNDEEVPSHYRKQSPERNSKSSISSISNSLNGWVRESFNWFYYQDGLKLLGWQTIEGKLYYLNSSGAAVTG